MRVSSIQLRGFRSFARMEPIQLEAINVLIGANNAGKSSILRGLYLMQQGASSSYQDVRVGGQTAWVKIGLEDTIDTPNWKDLGDGQLTITTTSTNRRDGNFELTFLRSSTGSTSIKPLLGVEPHHFIVPYLSKRKTSVYQEDVRLQYAMQVMPSMENLAAKLSRISNPAFPGHEQYRDTCLAILGFMVTAVPSEGGQRPGVYLPNRETIPIDQMGEGIPNVVTLLADLALSKGKLFLIEEPENDLHPAALKALLDLIIESSKTNQFVISTHSNIVLRHLGAIPSSRVYEVRAVPGRLPVEAEIRTVEPTPQARLEVLRDLGYSFSDFDLWDGWLILEEASAERIIRDYLIPWFVPRLSRIRTLSAAGAGNVTSTFEDFNRLVRFTHLEKAYTNAAWIRVDGDEVGRQIVGQLRKGYATWKPEHFSCFSHPQFERYYPTNFQEQIEKTLSINNKQQQRDAKRLLLNDVRKWLDADHSRGKAALKDSAHEIIKDLKKIESEIFS